MKRALAVLLVAAAALGPCLPGLLSGGALIPGDGGEIPLPGLAHAGAALAGGELPSWTPLLYAGAPLPASGGAAILYPPNALLFALLPPGPAYLTALGLHLLLAAWASAALARRLGASDAGQALAALAFACGGFVVGHTENLTRIEAIAYAPLAFLAAEALAREPGRRAAAGLALAMGLSALTSYYPFVVYFSAWALLYAALRGAQEGQLLKTAAWATAGAVGGVALSAAQTLPTIAATLRSSRLAAPDPLMPFDNSLHPRMLLELLAPLNTGSDHWDAQTVFYLGLAPLALAALAVATAQTRRRWRQPEVALAGIGAASLALSLGGYLPGYGLLTWLLPPLAELGRPYRLFVAGAVVLPALAGLGLGRLGTRRGVIAIAGVCVLAVVAAALGGSWLTVTLGGGAALAVLAWAQRGGWGWGWVAGGLLIAELVAFQVRLMGSPEAPLAAQRLETPETATWLLEHLGEHERFLSIRAEGEESPSLLWMQTPMRFGLASVNSPVSDSIPRWFMAAYGGGPLSAEALGLLRVRYVLAPRAWRGGQVVAEIAGLTISQVPAVAPRAFAVETLGGARDCGELTVQGSSRASLSLRVQSDRACLVVVTDAWDPDWRGQVDGEPVEIQRAHAALRAVAVPAGDHQVVMTYRPVWLWLGLGLSGLSLLGLGWLSRRDA